MRELIALRAKIDLMLSDVHYHGGWCSVGNGDDIYEDDSTFGNGYEYALQKVQEMIDKMVGDRLEEMYEEHLQEEASQNN
jgi:hypothetical protein